MQKNNIINTGFTSFTTVNSDQISEFLNTKCKTVKLSEYNIGENLGDLGLTMTFQIQSAKEKNGNLHFSKIKKIFSMNHTKRMKR